MGSKVPEWMRSLEGDVGELVNILQDEAVQAELEEITERYARSFR